MSIGLPVPVVCRCRGLPVPVVGSVGFALLLAACSGGTSPGATIWLYGDNDTFYRLSHSRANFDAFIAAGGTGSFHIHTRAPSLDGHFIVNDPSLWTDDLDTFVRSIGGG